MWQVRTWTASPLVRLGVRGGGVVAGLDQHVQTGDEERQSGVAQDGGRAAQDLEQPRDVLQPLRAGLAGLERERPSQPVEVTKR